MNRKKMQRQLSVYLDHELNEFQDAEKKVFFQNIANAKSEQHRNH